ncbi:hypothetical protein VTI28DRAFT_2184 [Corynascus sepedonium]
MERAGTRQERSRQCCFSACCFETPDALNIAIRGRSGAGGHVGVGCCGSGESSEWQPKRSPARPPVIWNMNTALALLCNWTV